jgi:predicted amidohydrolase YtcJ
MGALMRTDQAMWNYATEARNTGATLITDLGTSQLGDPEQVALWKRMTDDPEYPARVMVALSTMMGGSEGPEELAKIGVAIKDEATPKLKFGIVKLMLDGSNQGFTGRISWPHYYKPPPGHPGNGLWLSPPDTFADVIEAYHVAGLVVHVHCNGDEATEVFLDAVETVLERHPRWDHRHTVQHCQLSTKAQYKRMAAMGMCANIFSNHTFYWGDQHRDVTVGPERAAGMNACATALREGVPFSIHCDAPVTPMGHLHTMWCAVNRLTASGQVLGPHERISAEAALHSVTLGAAWQLKLDHEIGSIEAGKFADFAVLEDDPLTVPPETIKDIVVWGTVLGGKPMPADPRS